MAAAIDVQGLRKVYGTNVAVDDVTFAVDEGEIFGIIGPNGSGKTTTVECLQGLRVPDAGRLSVLGLDPRREGEALRHRIGSQLQESALPDRIRVWEALDLFAATSPNPGDWRQAMVDWGLERQRNTAFANLSGGQRQRMLVALALVNNPKLVFLDEMTTGLDPAARRVAWDLVEAVRDRGTTVVLVTHFMDEAEHLCDRVAVIRAGRVVACGTPAELEREHGGGVVVSFSLERRAEVPWLATVPGVADIRRDGDRFEVQGSGPLLARLGAALVANGHEPEDLAVKRASLEDVFLRLTEEEGHDAAPA